MTTQIDTAYFQEGKERLAELVGRLKWLSDRPPGSPERQGFYNLMVEIRDFLAHRFEYEFQAMIQNRYCDTHIHHQQHKLLLENLSWSIRSAQEQDCIPRFLCDFLTDWFQFHLENLDYDLYGLPAPTGSRKS